MRRCSQVEVPERFQYFVLLKRKTSKVHRRKDLSRLLDETARSLPKLENLSERTAPSIRLRLRARERLVSSVYPAG